MICLNDQLQGCFDIFETDLSKEQKIFNAAEKHYEECAQSLLDTLRQNFEQVFGIKAGDKVSIEFKRSDNVVFQFSAYYVGLCLNKGEAILNLNKIKKNGEMMIQRDPRYVRVNDIVSIK